MKYFIRIFPLSTSRGGLLFHLPSLAIIYIFFHKIQKNLSTKGMYMNKCYFHNDHGAVMNNNFHMLFRFESKNLQSI